MICRYAGRVFLSSFPVRPAFVTRGGHRKVTPSFFQVQYLLMSFGFSSMKCSMKWSISLLKSLLSPYFLSFLMCLYSTITIMMNTSIAIAIDPEIMYFTFSLSGPVIFFINAPCSINTMSSSFIKKL